MWNSTHSSWRRTWRGHSERGVALPGVLLLAAFLVGVTGWLVGHVRTDVGMRTANEEALLGSAARRIGLAVGRDGAWPAAGLDARRRAAPWRCPVPRRPFRSWPSTSRRSGRGCRTRRTPRADGGPIRLSGSRSGRATPLAFWGTGPHVARIRRSWSGSPTTPKATASRCAAATSDCCSPPWRTREATHAARRAPRCGGPAPARRWCWPPGGRREAELNSRRLLADHSKDDCPGHGSPRAWTWRRGWLDGSPACWSVFSWGSWRAPRWRNRWLTWRGRKRPVASR